MGFKKKEVFGEALTRKKIVCFKYQYWEGVGSTDLRYLTRPHLHKPLFRVPQHDVEMVTEQNYISFVFGFRQTAAPARISFPQLRAVMNKSSEICILKDQANG